VTFVIVFDKDNYECHRFFTVSELLADYPDLQAEDLLDCYPYAADLVESERVDSVPAGAAGSRFSAMSARGRHLLYEPEA
jgi:hypothetical protein